MQRPCLAAIGLLCLALVVGCAPTTPPSVAAPAGPQPPATSAIALPPSAVATTTFAPGSTIAGVKVEGLTPDEAVKRLREALAQFPDLHILAGKAHLTLTPATIKLTAPVDELVAEAATALSDSKPVTLPLRLRFDGLVLREQLRSFASQLGTSPSFSVLTSTDTISRSFVYSAGPSFDLDAAVAQVGVALSTGQTTTVTLALGTGTKPPRVPLARLREEVVAMANELPGVVGFHLTDLATGESIGLNERTVFSGASTIKVAILLNSYVNLASFTPEQRLALSKMIRYSDNLAANDLLAAAVDGQGTEDAFMGTAQMSTMLREKLGLRNTYLYIPFEATDFIEVYKPKYECGPKGPVGQKPYTETGPCLRTEPESMSQIYALIDQCANGKGLLLDSFDRLNPKRCQEMLDWLAQNDDDARIVAGVPKGVRVEHKSGWIIDMQGDTGIVRSPNGAYSLSIYYYRPLIKGRFYWTDEEMTPILAAFSRLAYTAYNPLQGKP